MEQDVVYRVDGAIGRIVIDRPEAGNMLSPDVLTGLGEIADRLAADRKVQVVVITGAGGEYFSAGILTPELKASLGKERVLEIVALANRVFDAIDALPQVVIAGVNGNVRAGAVELMLACDIRIAASHARLRMPEAKWGGFPGAGAPVRLPLIVGRGHALDLICTGREVDAQEMARIGLVERVVPSDQLTSAVDELAEAIAGSGPQAIRGAKRIVRQRLEPGFRASRELSDALRNAFEWTADADEGMAAHSEGRPPRFSGR